jgi:uncharacterized protein
VLITREELKRHPVRVEDAFDGTSLHCEGDGVLQVNLVDVKAVAGLAGEEIRIQGQLSTGLELECDRCAAPYAFPIHCEFDLYYRPMSSIARSEDIEVSDDELGVGFYEGEGIILEDVIREQVLLAVPMKMVCGSACKGLCPVCGINRNLASCQCQFAQLDSPFAALLPGSDPKAPSPH